MKPIIELSGLLSFRLFKTYLAAAHHSSWNVLEEINAVRTQMPTLIRRHDAVWMKLRTQASLYQITSPLFFFFSSPPSLFHEYGRGGVRKKKNVRGGWREGRKKKNKPLLQGVIMKTYNGETHNSVLVICSYEICMIMYYGIKTYNVLRGFSV